jgi:hypothetical protein
MLRQEKKEGEVAAVTAEDLQQLGLPYNTRISILYKPHDAEHEQCMLGKLLYADDPIFKDYYTIDRPGILPGASSNLLDHSLQVHLQNHSIAASKCMSKVARSRIPN